MQPESDSLLNDMNTLAVHSRAKWLIRAQSLDDFKQAFSFASEQQLPIRVLGGGSNVVLESVVDAVVVQPTNQSISIIKESDQSVVIEAGAGTNWHDLVMWAVEKSWYGFENLALIPGSVGASPIQNIGAYGVELASVVESVSFLLISSSTSHTLTAEQCEFAYRDSIFKHTLRDRAVITSVRFILSKIPKPIVSYPALQQALAASGKSVENPNELRPLDIANAVIAIRQSKLPDPKSIPNAGSFFKNPIVTVKKFEMLREEFPDTVGYAHGANHYKLAAGWLIDHIGLKGELSNGVGLHQDQALVLINPGQRSGATILKYAQTICKRVFDHYRVELEIEPRVYLAE